MNLQTYYPSIVFFIKFVRRGWIGRILLVGLTFVLTPLMNAQEAAEEAEEPIELEEFQVTGSRIKRIDIEGISPIDILTREDIARAGVATTYEILINLPAIVGGGNLSTGISNGGDGSANIALRGLPSSNTLVLVNGRRMATGGNIGDSDSPDIYGIPPEAIEQIEVLKDGASAIYGSDAIAGVVNIKLREDFEGMGVELYYGNTTNKDRSTFQGNIWYGTSTDKSNLFINVGYYKKEGIMSRDREVSKTADDREKGGFDGRSSAPPNSNFVLPDPDDPGSFSFYTLETDPDKIFPPLDGATFDEYPAVSRNIGLYNFREQKPSEIPQTRKNIFLIASHELTDWMEVFTEASYTEIKSFNSFAPLPVFTAFEARDIPVSKDNPFNPFGVDIIDARRRFTENGPRKELLSKEISRVVLGLRGSVFEERFDWELSYLYTKDELVSFVTGIFNFDRVIEALGDPADAPDAVPLNIFEPEGSVTPKMLDFVNTTATTSGNFTLEAFNGYLSGTFLDLPAGPLGIAVGFEYREEKGEHNPDAQTASGNTIGFRNFEPTKGSRDVTEGFIELSLPLFYDNPLAESLEVSLAVRISDYSDFGDTMNPKIGLKYRPFKDLLLRASYSEGFRAPSLANLYAGSAESFDTVNDPAFPGETEQIQILTITGGNPDLDPEESESYTLGLVYSPSFFKGLTFALDFFDLDQSNVVGASTQFIINQNFLTGAFADRVERNPVTGKIKKVTATATNIGAREVQGIDFSLIYDFPETPLGRFRFFGSGTYLDKWNEQIDSSQPFVGLAGTFVDPRAEGNGSLPRFRGYILLNWDKGPTAGSIQVNYISNYADDPFASPEPRRVDDWTTVDLQGSFTFEKLGGFKITAGVKNVTDAEPPFVAGAFNDSFDARTHNIVGTFYYFRFTKSF